MGYGEIFHEPRASEMSRSISRGDVSVTRRSRSLNSQSVRFFPHFFFTPSFLFSLHTVLPFVSIDFFFGMHDFRPPGVPRICSEDI